MPEEPGHRMKGLHAAFSQKEEENEHDGGKRAGEWKDS